VLITDDNSSPSIGFSRCGLLLCALSIPEGRRTGD